MKGSRVQHRTPPPRAIDFAWNVATMAADAHVSRDTVLRALHHNALVGVRISPQGWRVEDADYQQWRAAGCPTMPAAGSGGSVRAVDGSVTKLPEGNSPPSG